MWSVCTPECEKLAVDTKGSWFEKAGSEGLGQDNTLEDRGSAMFCCALNSSFRSSSCGFIETCLYREKEPALLNSQLGLVWSFLFFVVLSNWLNIFKMGVGRRWLHSYVLYYLERGDLVQMALGPFRPFRTHLQEPRSEFVLQFSKDTPSLCLG